MLSSHFENVIVSNNEKIKGAGMHLTIAIPTYNRCEYLKKNIESFDKVRRPNGIKLSLTISNSASEDSTEAYLEKISKRKTRRLSF